jgi:hypothetical protein
MRNLLLAILLALAPLGGGAFAQFAPSPSFSSLWVGGLTLGGALILGNWTTATRPSSPAQGETGWNTTILALETWNGTAWVTGGVTPGGTITGGALSGTDVSNATVIEANSIPQHLDAGVPTTVAIVAGMASNASLVAMNAWSTLSGLTTIAEAAYSIATAALPASGGTHTGTLTLTGLPTTCSGQPTNSVAVIAGVLTLCP